MDLSKQTHGDVVVITAADPRIDAAVAIEFKDRMRDLTADADGRVILDLEQVNFIDSSGLGAIVAAMKQLGGGKRLELAALSPLVDKVFRLTRMDSVFVIHDTTATGLGDASAAE
ncbi:STAS domain-containing protein [Fluviibacterium sp. DFM31]|uniref:Anti-sigma factor antagonist n=1 Tax=Meridianimarinicoccus marinus TaxID=3231483 RepID=A0ABV3L8L5_9RHOB